MAPLRLSARPTRSLLQFYCTCQATQTPCPTRGERLLSSEALPIPAIPRESAAKACDIKLGMAKRVLLICLHHSETQHFAARAWPVRARFTLAVKPALLLAIEPDFLVAVKPALLWAVKPAFLLGAQSSFLLVPLVAEPTFILVVAREALGAIVSALGRLWHGATDIAP